MPQRISGRVSAVDSWRDPTVSMFGRKHHQPEFAASFPMARKRHGLREGLRLVAANLLGRGIGSYMTPWSEGVWCRSVIVEKAKRCQRREVLRNGRGYRGSEPRGH